MSDHTEQLSVADSRRRVAVGSLLRSALLVLVSIAGLYHVVGLALAVKRPDGLTWTGLIGFTIIAVVFAVDVVWRLVQLATNRGRFARRIERESMPDHAEQLSIANSRRRIAIGSLVRSALLVLVLIATLIYVAFFILVIDPYRYPFRLVLIGVPTVASVFVVDVLVKLVQLAMNRGPFHRSR